MDHEQSNMVKTAVSVAGFGYTGQWGDNFILSNLVMTHILNCDANFLTVNEDGKAIAGGSVVVVANHVRGSVQEAENDGFGRIYWNNLYGMCWQLHSTCCIWNSNLCCVRWGWRNLPRRSLPFYAQKRRWGALDGP